jgi:hypothetical protein
VFAQYLRLGLHVADSDTEVVRRARRLILKRHRRDPAKRAARHRFYAQMLTFHAKARGQYHSIYNGGF